jgi:hypothetical protein
MLQTIQEETATNIYYPSPLQGLMGPEVSSSITSAGTNSRNTIWITGEFFGVQRARDMLFSVSVNKVRWFTWRRTCSDAVCCYLE